AVCGSEGQRHALSGPWRCDGSHRQRDGRRPGAPAGSARTGSRDMKGVVVLGSTGSVGENTLDVLGRHPERFRLVGIGANRNAARLAEQVLKWRPAYAAL